MEIGDLTPDEVVLIQKRRGEHAAQETARAFQRKAIAVANRWVEWSAETGEGLTFSTFINSFFYQEEDGKQVYAAVERILTAARPQ